jgi:hypothetical protein
MFNPFDEKEKYFYKPPIFFRISDFFVDFFGTLIPGIIFTAILLFFIIDILIIIILFMCNVMQIIPCIEIKFIKDIVTIIKEFYFILIVFFIVSAYIFGHIFYRFGPKMPDQKSFLRIFDKIYVSAYTRDAKQFSQPAETGLAEAVEQNCQGLSRFRAAPLGGGCKVKATGFAAIALESTHKTMFNIRGAATSFARKVHGPPPG